MNNLHMYLCFMHCLKEQTTTMSFVMSSFRAALIGWLVLFAAAAAESASASLVNTVRRTQSCSEQYSTCRSTCSKTCAQAGQACYATTPSFISSCNSECSSTLNACDDSDTSNGADDESANVVGEATCAEVEILTSCEDMNSNLANRNTKYYPIDPTTCPGPDVDQSYPVYRSNPIPDTDRDDGNGPSYNYIWRTKQVWFGGVGNVPNWYFLQHKQYYCGDLDSYYRGMIRDTQDAEPFLFEDDSAPQEVRCLNVGDYETHDLEIRCNRMVGEKDGKGKGNGDGDSSGGMHRLASLSAGLIAMMLVGGSALLA